MQIDIVLYEVFLVICFSVIVWHLFRQMKKEYNRGDSPWQKNKEYFLYWDGHRRSFHELIHLHLW